jgi:SagB-type dehydrogenase family enzyme
VTDAREYHERTKLSLTEPVPDGLTPDPDPEHKPRLWKAYADRPRTALGRVRPTPTPALSAVAHARAAPRTPEEPPVDLDTVTTLCYEGSGVTQVTERDGERVRYRAASCTGRKYHVNCYLVTGRLPGLAAGVYHFDPAGFGLDRLREGDHRGALVSAVEPDAAAGGGPDSATTSATGVGSAPVSVVLTSEWWRNAWQYGDRTYRHALWDAGTVAANLLATAHGLDHRAAVVGAFDDDGVAALLGLDTDEEFPVAVLPVGRGDPVAAADPAAPIDPEVVPPGERTREHSIVTDAWRGSRLSGDGVDAWRRRAREAGTVGSAAGDGERVPLDPVDPATAAARPLHATVKRRGSCREYAQFGPTRRQVATVLDRATRGVPGDWRDTASAQSDESAPTPGLAYSDLHLLTTGVEGLVDGHYRYEPATDELRRLGETSRQQKHRLSLGQEWAAEAHVNVYMLTDLETLTDRLGSRGYRLAQLESGVTLGRLYLATYAHRDLGGTGLTFADDAVTEHCDPDGGRTPTCLFAFGRRAD